VLRAALLAHGNIYDKEDHMQLPSGEPAK